MPSRSKGLNVLLGGLLGQAPIALCITDVASSDMHCCQQRTYDHNATHSVSDDFFPIHKRAND